MSPRRAATENLPGCKTYQVTVDRTKAAELGVSVADVAGTLRSLITGAVVSRYRQSNEYYNIRVLVPEERLISRRSVEDLVLTRAQGDAVRVRDVASVRQSTGPLEIVRKNQVKQITVEADTAGIDINTAVDGLRKKLKDIDLPAGYEFGFGGQAELLLRASYIERLQAVAVGLDEDGRATEARPYNAR